MRKARSIMIVCSPGCSGSWLRSLQCLVRLWRRLKEIDRVAIGIAKQHGAIAPRHVLGLLQPVGHDAVDTFPLAVDIVDFELKDRRLIGTGDPFSPMHEFGGLPADDGENSAL